VDGAPGLVLRSTLGERAGVHRVEADLVDQLRDRPFGVFVVARDGDADPGWVSCGPP
jgi:hypothetical protein